MTRLGVLTSGGDAPGMNACIRAVVRSGLDVGMEVVGIRRGFEGIFERDVIGLDRRAIVNIVQRGGTILGTARSQRMRSDSGVADAVSALHELGIEALVVIGGDGSFRGAAALEAAGGPPTAGVPGTIDNDVVGSEVSLGFDTAVNTALDAIDRIRDTATSHEMLHFVEVMGRRCGAIALAAGVAGGAEAVLVPERPVSDDDLARRIAALVAAGKRSVIVVVSEGARTGGAAEAALQVGAALGLDYRLTVLGHVQRGGAPSAADRLLAAVLGTEAVGALASGGRSVFIGVRYGRPVRVAYEVGATTKSLDPILLGVVDKLA
ncbi:MAG: ATP-dependent 6-phosphofructokinase [Acidimicrobiia bacterium]|nr:ATP-dependent 6-phosphofructokinase [Acidimicrobiia bacterium]